MNLTLKYPGPGQQEKPQNYAALGDERLETDPALVAGIGSLDAAVPHNAMPVHGRLDLVSSAAAAALCFIHRGLWVSDESGWGKVTRTGHTTSETHGVIVPHVDVRSADDGGEFCRVCVKQEECYTSQGEEMRIPQMLRQGATRSGACAYMHACLCVQGI